MGSKIERDVFGGNAEGIDVALGVVVGLFPVWQIALELLINAVNLPKVVCAGCGAKAAIDEDEALFACG